MMLMGARFGAAAPHDARGRSGSMGPLIDEDELAPLAEAALSASLPSDDSLAFPGVGHFRSQSDGGAPSAGRGAATHETYDAMHLSLAGYREDPFIARPLARASRRRRTDPVYLGQPRIADANALGKQRTAAIDHDRRKEIERTELIEMILESVASVPMALEKIHTNTRLREALEQEIGGEHELLHRFFEVPTPQNGVDKGEESQVAPPSWGDQIDGPLEESNSESADKDPSDGDSASSEYDSEYENDLAEAVNQLVMTEGSLTSAEQLMSTPIEITSSDGVEKTSNRTSHSPQSSIFGASPSTFSQDGEPAAALWPRQPHQFAFTQEEEEEEVGTPVQDEVYSEMVAAMGEDDTFLEEDDQGIEELEKVFEMGDDQTSDLINSHSSGGFQRQDLAIGSRLNLVNDGQSGTVANGEAEVDMQAEEGEADMADEEYDLLELRVFRVKERTGFEANEDWRPRIGSIVGDRYCVQMEIGEAVFSRTYKCRDTRTDQGVCLKVIKNSKEYFDQGIDEVRILQYISDNCDVDEKHFVRLHDFFYFREHLVIVMELLRDNLYELSKLLLERGHANYFTIPRLKKVAIEVLGALDFLHTLGLIHCDLKPENILISNFDECRIKVIDFGSACFVTDELTSYVQSRSYRAPEVVLGLGYDHKIDVWSLGCVLAELFTGEVLFKNDSEQSLLERIIGAIGPIPNDLLMENSDLDVQFTENPAFAMDPETGNGILSPLHPPMPTLDELVQTSDTHFLDFLRSLLQIHPSERVSAAEALRHPWLQSGVFSRSHRT